MKLNNDIKLLEEVITTCDNILEFLKENSGVIEIFLKNETNYYIKSFSDAAQDFINNIKNGDFPEIQFYIDEILNLHNDAMIIVKSVKKELGIY